MEKKKRINTPKEPLLYKYEWLIVCIYFILFHFILYLNFKFTYITFWKYLQSNNITMVLHISFYIFIPYFSFRGVCLLLYVGWTQTQIGTNIVNLLWKKQTSSTKFSICLCLELPIRNIAITIVIVVAVVTRFIVSSVFFSSSSFFFVNLNRARY